MGTAVVVLVVVVLLLFLALGLGVRNARRSMRGREQRDAQRTAGALGRELFDRSRRLDLVIEQAEQARALAAHVDSVHAREIDALATRLEESCEIQRHRVLAVAPLTGRSREVAIGRLEPAIQGLEEAGGHLVALGDRAAATADPARASRDAELVGRQARALDAAILELEGMELEGMELEGMELEGLDLPAPGGFSDGTDLPAPDPAEEPPQAAG